MIHGLGRMARRATAVSSPAEIEPGPLARLAHRYLVVSIPRRELEQLVRVGVCHLR